MSDQVNVFLLSTAAITASVGVSKIFNAIPNVYFFLYSNALKGKVTCRPLKINRMLVQQFINALL